MNRILATATVSLALILSGLVHGRWTDRWTTSTAPAEAATRFDKVSEFVIGEWGKGEPIDAARTPADDQIAGTLQRRYKNGRNQELAIVLVCGRPGPVSIHSPDICYTASGFTVGTPTRITVDGTKATFWTATATRVTATQESRLRLFWAWNAGDGWTASDDPRVAFARRPVLHKLYVVRDLDSLNEDVKKDPSLTFMQEFLPQLDATLFQQGS
jgi:hypothetical protein